MEIVLSIALICAAGAIITFVANCIMVLGFGMFLSDDPVSVTMVLPWVFIVIGHISVAAGYFIKYTSM